MIVYVAKFIVINCFGLIFMAAGVVFMLVKSDYVRRNYYYDLIFLIRPRRLRRKFERIIKVGVFYFILGFIYTVYRLIVLGLVRL